MSTSTHVGVDGFVVRVVHIFADIVIKPAENAVFENAQIEVPG